MNPIYKKTIFLKSPLGIPPQLETPVSVVDCNATTMSMASGGQYFKRDKIHLDKNAKGESFGSLIPPRDIFDADTKLRGLGAYIQQQVNAVGTVENKETTSQQISKESIVTDGNLPFEPIG